MRMKLFLVPLILALVFLVYSCGDDGGPNVAPDTEIVSGPGSTQEYRVPIEWSGSDPDGWVASYEIAWYSGPLEAGDLDTLLTWEGTEAVIDTFEVLADSGCAEAACHHAHTFFVRAIDNEGAKDPTPASVSFTATTTPPRTRIIFPPREEGELDVFSANCVKIRWEGIDDDGEAVQFRVARKPYSEFPAGEPPSFDDPTKWGEWSTDTEITVWPLFPLPDEDGWSFFIQARDNAGAVETDFSGTRNHIRVFVQEDWKNLPGLQVSLYEGPCYLKGGAFITSRSTAGDTTQMNVPVDIAVGDTICFRASFWPGAFANEVTHIQYQLNDSDSPTSWRSTSEEGNWDHPLGDAVFTVSPGHHTMYVWIKDDYCLYGSARRAHVQIRGVSAN
jgi:hypothetical protein